MNLDIEYDFYKLVKANMAVPVYPEGYTICLYLGHDGMEFDWAPFELGIFREDQKDLIVKITSQLGMNLGKKFRGTFNGIMSVYSEVFPVNEEGIGPYLIKMAVCYHDGKGNKYIMEPEERTDK